jgi:aspartate/methionine/tyrosine aminotransferase
VFSGRFADDPGGLNPHWEEKLRLEAAGTGLIDLTLSNPTLADIAYPPGIPSLLARPEAMAYHPNPRGSPEARRAVAEYLRGRGRPGDPDRLVLTASTSEAYSWLFKLLCEPGDEVLVPSPSYPLFDDLADLERVSLLRYPLSPNPGAGGYWDPDFDRLRNLISTRTKALILVNPNNPTGHVLGQSALRAYRALAEEYGLALIVDEVFSDYVLAEDAVYLPMESDGPLVFTLNGFSKLLALPQLKLGWIHVDGRPALIEAALDRLEFIADAFLSVNTPVQAAAADLLKLARPIQAAIGARLQANLKASWEWTVGSRTQLYSANHPQAGWYLLLHINSRLGPEDLALELLRERHVHTHPGDLFGLGREWPIVASLLTPELAFREGLRRIAEEAEEQARA